MEEEQYMRRAIALAENGIGYTCPNPMVGAVIVKDGQIIGEGFHERCGGLHAERNALASCVQDPCGATMYVTLEPCCHYGRTPPCTEAIIEAGIAKVLIGSRDVNPKVAGKGVRQLREAGILVQEDVLRAECDAINAVFFHYITTGFPYVALKYAMTADGKIATVSGASKWITGETARAHVQTLRHRYSGIIVGIGTVLADDPMLNCRLEGGVNPLRIICDSQLRTPVESALCRTANEIPTLIVCAQAEPERKALLEQTGAEVLQLPSQDGRVDLRELFQVLGKRGIDSVLVEGGGELHFSLLEQQLAQKLYVYLAPKIFGGAQAKTPVGGAGIALPEQAFLLSKPTITVLSEDILLEYEMKRRDADVHGNH